MKLNFLTLKEPLDVVSDDFGLEGTRTGTFAFLRDDLKDKGDVLFMEKNKPYPCNKQNFKSKDGIHIAFPGIIISKNSYKQIIQFIQPNSIQFKSIEFNPPNSIHSIRSFPFNFQ